MEVGGVRVYGVAWGVGCRSADKSGVMGVKFWMLKVRRHGLKL